MADVRAGVLVVDAAKATAVVVASDGVEPVASSARFGGNSKYFTCNELPGELPFLVAVGVPNASIVCVVVAVAVVVVLPPFALCWLV